MMAGAPLATGCHQIKVKLNDMNQAGSDEVISCPFKVGAYLWRIKFIPDATSRGKPGYVSVYIVREDATALIVKAQYEFSVLVENKLLFIKTKAVCFKRADSMREFSYKTECGFPDFAKQEVLSKLIKSSKKKDFFINCCLDIMGTITIRASPASNSLQDHSAMGHRSEADLLENEEQVPIFWGEMRSCSGDTTHATKILTKIQPCGVISGTGYIKVKLTMYHELQETVIDLWNSKIVQPDLNSSDPYVLILDEKGTLYRLQSAYEGDIDQIRSFYNACIGFEEDGIRTLNPLPRSSYHGSVLEDLDLEMGIKASIVTARQEGSLPSSVWPGCSSSSAQPSAPPLNPARISGSANVSGGGTYGQCSICLDSVADTACIPCGHAAGCHSCMTKLDWTESRCPICRSAVTDVMKVHLV